MGIDNCLKYNIDIHGDRIRYLNCRAGHIQVACYHDLVLISYKFDAKRLVFHDLCLQRKRGTAVPLTPLTVGDNSTSSLYTL